MLALPGVERALSNALVSFTRGAKAFGLSRTAPASVYRSAPGFKASRTGVPLGATTQELAVLSLVRHVAQRGGDDLAYGDELRQCEC